MTSFSVWRLNEGLLVLGVNVLWQVTLVAGVALLAARLLRHNPVARSWTLCSALCLILLTPVLALTVPSYGDGLVSVTVDPSAASGSDAPDVAVANSVLSGRSVERPVDFDVDPADYGRNRIVGEPTVTLDPAEADGPRHDPSSEAEAGMAGRVQSDAAGSAASVPLVKPTVATTSVVVLVTKLMPILVGIWGVGMLLLLIRMVRSHLQLLKLIREARPAADPALRELFSQSVRGLQGRCMPQLLLSGSVSGPIATGIVWPRILIPEGISEQVGAAQLRDVLMHEVAHIERRDQVMVWLQNLAAVVFWIHPLVRVLNRQLGQAREEVCDNYVLSATDAPSYSRTLLTLAQLTQTPRLLPGVVGLFTSRWELENRISGLLDERRRRGTRLSGSGAAGITLMALLAAVVVSQSRVSLANSPVAEEDALTVPVAVDDEPSAESPASADGVSDSEADAAAPAASGVWQPGDPGATLPGLIPAPADLPGLGRWQAMMTSVTGYVESAEFSPDSSTIVFGDGVYVRIHDVPSLELSGVLVGHAGNVKAVRWSPDGQWIASADEVGVVRLWTADGAPVRIFEEHEAPVRSVAWHPDSQQLATASLDGTIRIQAVDGTSQTVIEGHDAPVITLDWSPDGTQIAAGDENRIVRLWSPDGTAGPVLEGHHGVISRVRWSPDGQWIASTSMGLLPTEPSQQPIATTRLWRADGTEGPTLHGHNRSIRALAWGPNSDQLVTAAEDRTVRLWSVDGRQLAFVERGGSSRDSSDLFALDWDEKTGLIAAAGRGTVRFLTTDGPTGTQRLTKRPGGKLMSLDWHPSQNRIALAIGNQQVHVWSDGFSNPQTIDAGDTTIGRVKWNPDGTRLATISFADVVRIWDNAGELVHEFPCGRGVPRGLSWSPDGTRLAVAKRYGPSHILDMEGNQQDINVHEGGLGGLSFSPDGRSLLTGGFDANVRVVETGDPQGPVRETALMQAFDGDVDSVAWSPDGEWLASGHDMSLCLWRPDGSPGPAVLAGEAAIMRIDWAPDSQRLVTGSWDSSVRLWDLDGELLREFNGHTAPCWGVSFSPDGSQLGTCGWDGIARILDVESGETQAMAIYIPGTDAPDEAGGELIPDVVAFNRAGQITSCDPDVVEAQIAFLVEQPSGAFQVMKLSQLRKLVPQLVLAADE